MFTGVAAEVLLLQRRCRSGSPEAAQGKIIGLDGSGRTAFFTRSHYFFRHIRPLGSVIRTI